MGHRQGGKVCGEKGVWGDSRVLSGNRGAVANIS